MARFRVRDLMIQVAQANPQLACLPIHSFCHWFSCHWFTPCHWHTPGGCWPLFTCPGGSIICGPLSPDPCGVISPYVGDPGEFVVQPEDLSVLKEQLKQALVNIERQERALEEADRPQTVEEAEALEEKLKEAIKELQVRKEELKKRPDRGK